MATSKTTTKTIAINHIRIDGNTQSRCTINQEVVAEYAALLSDHVILPSITLFFDGAEYWLADGFHRLHAHRANKKTHCIAEVHKGTQRDAVLYSLNANVPHGLNLSSEDKRKGVLTMLADPEWSELSDRAIARHCGCSHMTVGRLRNRSKPKLPQKVEQVPLQSRPKVEQVPPNKPLRLEQVPHPSRLTRLRPVEQVPKLNPLPRPRHNWQPNKMPPTPMATLTPSPCWKKHKSRLRACRRSCSP